PPTAALLALPYPTLFRSEGRDERLIAAVGLVDAAEVGVQPHLAAAQRLVARVEVEGALQQVELPGRVVLVLDQRGQRLHHAPPQDRKSTRLNSSHVKISY